MIITGDEEQGHGADVDGQLLLVSEGQLCEAWSGWGGGQAPPPCTHSRLKGGAGHIQLFLYFSFALL